MKYEYRTLKINRAYSEDSDRLERDLNKLGQEGWHVLFPIQFTIGTGYGYGTDNILLMEREVSE